MILPRMVEVRPVVAVNFRDGMLIGLTERRKGRDLLLTTGSRGDALVGSSRRLEGDVERLEIVPSEVKPFDEAFAATCCREPDGSRTLRFEAWRAKGAGLSGVVARGVLGPLALSFDGKGSLRFVWSDREGQDLRIRSRVWLIGKPALEAPVTLHRSEIADSPPAELALLQRGELQLVAWATQEAKPRILVSRFAKDLGAWSEPDLVAEAGGWTENKDDDPGREARRIKLCRVSETEVMLVFQREGGCYASLSSDAGVSFARPQRFDEAGQARVRGLEAVGGTKVRAAWIETDEEGSRVVTRTLALPAS